MENNRQSPEIKINDIAILYFGTKGSLPGMTFSICKELKYNTRLNKVIISEKQEMRDMYLQEFSSECVCLDIPNTLPKIFNISKLLKTFSVIKKILKESDCKVVVITMHHPWSIIMLPLLKINFITASIIHDLLPHEGGNKLVHYLDVFIVSKFSTKILFLTKNQKESFLKNPFLRKENKYIDIIKHPSFIHLSNLKKVSNNNSKEIDFLFFGRLELYKGIDILIEAFKLLKTKIPEVSLTIAGRKNSNLYIEKINGINYILDYISEKELIDLILKSKIVVLPYKSATQSGVMVLAHDLGCDIISTPVKGLIEQSLDIENVYFTEEISSISLYKTMKYALENYKTERSEPKKISSNICNVNFY